jgi:hypothetical protein
MWDQLVVDSILAVVAAALIWLASRLEPGFIPPSGLVVNCLMGLATCLIVGVASDLFQTLIVYPVVQVILSVLFWTFMGWLSIQKLREHQRQNMLKGKQRKRYGWSDYLRVVAIVIGILVTTLIVVLIGTFTMY